MATIKEIVNKKYHELYNMGCDENYIEAYCEGVKDGVNDILDTIEKFAESTWGNSLTLISLKKKIKELKKE